MKNYIKLVNFELNRFVKLYTVLIAVIFIIQTGGVIFSAYLYMKRAKDATIRGGISQADYINMYGKFTLSDTVYSMFYIGAIALGVAALVFYVFFIWYRDWFAKNTFIYRLLMLPTSRMNVYFAKLTTIMLTVLGLAGLQIIFLLIQSKIVKWMVPHVYRADQGIGEVVNSTQFLSFLFPNGFAEFVIAYGIGMAAVLVIFT